MSTFSTVQYLKIITYLKWHVTETQGYKMSKITGWSWNPFTQISAQPCNSCVTLKIFQFLCLPILKNKDNNSTVLRGLVSVNVQHHTINISNSYKLLSCLKPILTCLTFKIFLVCRSSIYQGALSSGKFWDLQKVL